MRSALARLEQLAGRTFGRGGDPLLVAVRSGAAQSMPGMMDTILNLGLNDRTVEGLKARTSNGRFAYDSYRRFIQMFGNVVLEISKDAFEHTLDEVKKARGAKVDTDLDEAALREVVEKYKQVTQQKKRDGEGAHHARQLGARTGGLRNRCARGAAADREALKESRCQIGGAEANHLLVRIDLVAQSRGIGPREHAGVGE